MYQWTRVSNLKSLVTCLHSVWKNVNCFFFSINNSKNRREVLKVFSLEKSRTGQIYIYRAQLLYTVFPILFLARRHVSDVTKETLPFPRSVYIFVISFPQHRTLGISLHDGRDCIMISWKNCDLNFEILYGKCLFGTLQRRYYLGTRRVLAINAAATNETVMIILIRPQVVFFYYLTAYN